MVFDGEADPCRGKLKSESEREFHSMGGDYPQQAQAFVNGDLSTENHGPLKTAC